MNSQLTGDISLGRVRLRVADLNRTATWLERVLGLRALPASANRGCFGVTEAQPLVEVRAQAGLRPAPRRGLLGLYHYAILLPSRADLGRFLLHLGELGEHFGASDHLFSEAIYLTDPDGITVEVYADRPRETWTYKGDDIVGALDPLDGEGLARAAGDSRWQGTPAGTRMGHVHFYVGDLAAAEKFYVDGLGFGVSTRAFPGALFVGAGGYHHHVGLNTWAAGHPIAGAADAGLDSWSLLIPAAAERMAVLARLAAQGVALEHEGDVAIARDPWQIAVRIGGD